MPGLPLTRREAIGVLAAACVPSVPRARSAIFLHLAGGLSHLDSFDPKPEAPREIRGPFGAIRTSVPGVRFSEHLPRLAQRAHRLTVLRSMCSEETNHERAGALLDFPGAVRIVARGPLVEALAEARRRIEAGAPIVVVEPHALPYDTHAEAFERLARVLLPELDFALATLLDDLEARGLLASTLVVATGEFGRTPRINGEGGRDHYAGAWSALLAGGGLTGGRVLGETDRRGAEVRDLPVRPQDLARTILAALGRQPAPGQAAWQGRVIREILA
jgi:hypothetical protein